MASLWVLISWLALFWVDASRCSSLSGRYFCSSASSVVSFSGTL